MKNSKKSIVCFFAFCLLTELFAVGSNVELDQDLQSFKYIISQNYAAYDEAAALGFKIDDAIDTIKYRYQKNYSGSLNSDLLAECIFSVLNEDFPIKDQHLTIKSESKTFFYSDVRWRMSDVYFEKKGNDFFTVRNYFLLKIKKNQKYTGDLENLFPCVYHGKDMFRFGILTDKIEHETSISIEGENIRVPIFIDIPFASEKDKIGIRKTGTTLYVSLSDCILASDNEKTDRQIKKDFDSALTMIEKGGFENLIIDLRSNKGGYIEHVTSLLEALYCGNDNNIRSNFQKCMNDSYQGSQVLYSPDIAAAYANSLNNIGALSEESVLFSQQLEKEMKDNPHRYFDIVEKKSRTLTKMSNSLFKGKIIFLINLRTASAAEQLICLSYLRGQDNIIVVGSNSHGCLDFGGIYCYTLPNSGIELYFPNVMFKESLLLTDNSHWHGDGYGFYPDYWTDSKHLIDTLIYITNDRNIKKNMKGLAKGLLDN